MHHKRDPIDVYLADTLNDTTFFGERNAHLAFIGVCTYLLAQLIFWALVKQGKVLSHSGKGGESRN